MKADMNRIDKLFQNRTGEILSVYFTAGFPSLNSTAKIIETLQYAGADMIEIGIPFSDPLADGPVIQKSSSVALKNGMNLKLLFGQLTNIRSEVNIPLILMGYINPVLKFGMDNFYSRCSEIGIDGVILPDLPPEIFLKEYSTLFERHNLYNIFLISPQSNDERIRFIDWISRGFIYMVSSSSTTGIRNEFSHDQRSYFKRIREMRLKNPLLTGFGISDNRTFIEAGTYSDGAIIGSAFIKILEESGTGKENITGFINKIRSGSEIQDHSLDLLRNN
jgi:tryptophan synthase alpha chain